MTEIDPILSYLPHWFSSVCPIHHKDILSSLCYMQHILSGISYIWHRFYPICPIYYANTLHSSYLPNRYYPVCPIYHTYTLQYVQFTTHILSSMSYLPHRYSPVCPIYHTGFRTNTFNSQLPHYLLIAMPFVVIVVCGSTCYRCYVKKTAPDPQPGVSSSLWSSS